MKKLFSTATLLCLIFMVSCKDSASTSSTTTTSSAEKNNEHMAAVYKGIESGDMSKMDEFVADDIVDHGMPAEVRGRDSVKKMLADIHNHMSNLKMEVISEATSASGDYHFALVRMTGTTTDNAMGRPANTAVDETSVDVVKLKDGKAVEHWGYADPMAMMKMMEMSKGMPMDNKMMDNKMNDKMQVKDSSAKK